MPNDDGISKDEVELARVIERSRAIRWTAVSAAIVFSVWIVADATVKIVNRPQPAWLTVVLAILAAVGLGASPTLWILAWVRSFIRRQVVRIAELEQSVDPTRTSSNLRTDGTLPND
jgi:hypothetical protein